MITLPSSPSPQNTPDSAHRQSSSLGSMSPTTIPPRLKLPESHPSPVEDPIPRSTNATSAIDLGSEADPDEQSLISELSDLSDDPDFQRRVEERGQKRVILRELTSREANGDELNEEEQALLSELRRAQEIETAAWSGGAGGLFEVEKIETTHWERYKEALRAEAMAAEDGHPESGGEEDLYDEDGQDRADPINGGYSEPESEMGRRSPYGALRLLLLQNRLCLKIPIQGGRPWPNIVIRLTCANDQHLLQLTHTLNYLDRIVPRHRPQNLGQCPAPRNTLLPILVPPVFWTGRTVVLRKIVHLNEADLVSKTRKRRKLTTNGLGLVLRMHDLYREMAYHLGTPDESSQEERT